MRFQVEFSSLRRRLLVGGIALGAILCAAIASRLFFVKTPFELTTPRGEQTIMLPAIGSAYLDDDGARAAIIRKRFGSLSVTALGEYLIDGGQQSRKLSTIADSFVIANQSLNRIHEYQIRKRRIAKQDKQDRHDDFLDRM